MKIEGRTKNKKLQLLIDSESTHNFLDSFTVERLGCRTEQVPPPMVLVANGSEMSCNRACRGFKWHMQGQHFEVNVYLIPLKNNG